MQLDDDSVSTFHLSKIITLTKDPDSNNNEDDTTPKSTNFSPVGILRTPRTHDDAVSHISMSDSTTRISSLETEISAMDRAFREEIGKLQSQAQLQANAQAAHGSLLSEILSMVQKLQLPQVTDSSHNTSEAANPPQTVDAGSSSGAAGNG